MQGVFDHLVVAGERLELAVAHAEAALGLTMQGGGAHEAMGTHNRLLSLGETDYLEALAVDPRAASPAHPRWFGLDRFEGPPRLVGWALRVDDLDAALKLGHLDAGRPFEAARGPYRWRISLPEGGLTPFDGLCPALIQWLTPPPAPALTDHGARLVSLTISHPGIGDLGWMLSQLTEDDRIVARSGPPGLKALFHTPAGERVLS